MAVRLDWADVVRDGVVWDFFGAVQIVRRQLESLAALFGAEQFNAVGAGAQPQT